MEVNKEIGSLSSDKLLKIMECLAQRRLPSRLTDLAKQLDMSQSTVLRYLRTLHAQGYVYHDEPTGCYALTWKICKLGDAVKVNLVLRSMASPFLNAMSNELDVGMLLVIEVDGGVMYLDCVDNPHSVMKTLVRIGRNAPMHTTGSGKVLLSSFPRRKVCDIIDKNGLERLTEHTITDSDRLFEELDRVRIAGYALDNEECEQGHRCVSVPLYDYTGAVAAAISAFDHADSMTDERIQAQILPELMRISAEISKRMGYEGSAYTEFAAIKDGAP